MSKASRRASIAIFIFVGALLILFLNEPENIFLWVKSFHLIAVISWMAGLLYLPRLFINHIVAQDNPEQAMLFSNMEERLLKIIMTPAMIITWVLGLWMVYYIYEGAGYWLWIKLVLVFILSGVHGFFEKSARLFSENKNIHSDRFWRLFNEVPTVIMIFVVILVIVKPF